MLTKRILWLLYITGSIIFLSIPFINPPQSHTGELFTVDNMAIQDFFRYLLLLLFFYLNYFLLIPRLYFTKKHTAYFLLLLFIMISIASVSQLFSHISLRSEPATSYSMGPPPAGGHVHPAGPGDGQPGSRRPNFFFARLDHNLFLFIAVAFLSLLLRISDRWRKTEQEKLNAELSYLKAQINPHFLFNTLNSIYSLAIQKSDSTPEAVQKLSSMMRYILTEATNNFVPLEKELEYIRNYIDLQKLRFGSEIRLKATIQGVEANKRIAPLILIAFIENAFKYGMNAAEDTDINITIHIYEDRLEMRVSNNIVSIYVTDEEKTGVGIENTSNRLDLLYPYAHKLTISQDEKQYHVNLMINFI